MVKIDYEFNTLVISITSSSPDYYREALIKSVAASIRWRAHSLNEELRVQDNEHQIILSDLLETLMNVSK